MMDIKKLSNIIAKALIDNPEFIAFIQKDQNIIKPKNKVSKKMSKKALINQFKSQI